MSRIFSQHPVMLSGELRTEPNNDKPRVPTQEKYKALNPHSGTCYLKVGRHHPITAREYSTKRQT